MESREEPPDCLYLSMFMAAVSCTNVRYKACTFIQVMRKCIYSACTGNCVNTIKVMLIWHI